MTLVDRWRAATNEWLHVSNMMARLIEMLDRKVEEPAFVAAHRLSWGEDASFVQRGDKHYLEVTISGRLFVVTERRPAPKEDSDKRSRKVFGTALQTASYIRRALEKDDRSEVQKQFDADDRAIVNLLASGTKAMAEGNTEVELVDEAGNQFGHAEVGPGVDSGTIKVEMPGLSLHGRPGGKDD